jgi:hypothetical protein
MYRQSFTAMVRSANANLEYAVQQGAAVQYCHDLGVCDYRRGMDWIFVLLTTCIHHSELHFTDH